MNQQKLKHDFDIHIVGVGGVGSKVAEQLLRGDCGELQALHLWDDDVVKPHNLGNQAFIASCTGLPKVAALCNLARLDWNSAKLPFPHNERIVSHQKLSGVVIVCPDSMQSRKDIWESSVKGQKNVYRMIETRADALNGHIFCVDPNNEIDVFEWEKYWHPSSDSVNEGAGCGLRPLPSQVATIVSGLVCTLVTRFAAKRQGFPAYKEDSLENLINLRTFPLELERVRW